MIPFLLALAVCWPISGYFVAWRPKRSSAFLAFPVLLGAAAAVTVGYFILLMEMYPDTVPLMGNGFKSALMAALICTFRAWKEAGSAGKLTKTMKARDEAARSREASEHAASASGQLETHGLARRAIEHRPEVAAEWVLIQQLGGDWIRRFLDAMEADPQAEPRDVSERIARDIREAFPFSRDDLDQAYRRITPMSETARRDFRQTIFALGETVRPDMVAETILKSGAYEPGLYEAGRIQIRIGGDRSVIMFRGKHGEELNLRFDDVPAFLDRAGLTAESLRKA